jgi:hypothetical protein
MVLIDKLETLRIRSRKASGRSEYPDLLRRACQISPATRTEGLAQFDKVPSQGYRLLQARHFRARMEPLDL